MRYILGIDQGASKTHAIIGNEFGNIMGIGKSYGACHSTNGMEIAMRAVREAADLAIKQSGITIKDVDIIAAGMTGLDWDFEKDLLEDALFAEFHVPRIEAVNDAVIAMQAGTRKKYGCILCAGSGLNCVVKKDSTTKLVYGYYINEEYQGGISIGKKTLEAVFHSNIGFKNKTILTELLLDYFHVNTVDELLYKKVSGGISEKDYLYLPIILEKSASMNDIVSLEIFADYGENIAKYVIHGMEKLNMLDMDVDVILSGSIFKCKIPVLHDSVAFQIHKFATNAKIVDALYEPIVGALLLGIDKLYGEISNNVYENIENCSSKFNIKRL